MNPRKSSHYGFFAPRLWSKNEILIPGSTDNEAAKRGLIAGAGLGAGLAIRGGLFRTLIGAALLAPSMAALGMFANVALTRRNGIEKQDELIRAGLESGLIAKNVISDAIKSFTK